jgi:ubiquitin-like modifier-activating enzyme 5
MSEALLRAEIVSLKAELDAARAAIKAASSAPRGKIAEMSAEVVDSNPYSRLMALKRMGIGMRPMLERS